MIAWQLPPPCSDEVGVYLLSTSRQCLTIELSHEVYHWNFLNARRRLGELSGSSWEIIQLSTIELR